MTTEGTIEVLDHGQVTLLDHMGGDGNVTGSARVSTGKSHDFVSKGPEADAKLITHLLTHGHGTPFEHSVFQFFVKAPIFVVREWQRHRIGSYNEQSGRYSAFKPEFYLPDHLRTQHPTNKQSSVADRRDAIAVRSTLAAMQASMEGAFAQYDRLLNEDSVAREMARMILPVSTYTSMWWTVNARSLMNFLALRNHPDAQYEIRVYAVAIEGMFASTMPMTYKAFVDAGRRAP